MNINLLARYLRNDRIKEYEGIIKTLREKGYQMVSLAMYAQGKYNPQDKMIILRHDIDHLSMGTRLMFAVEKKYEAYASYYFRDSQYDERTAEADLMRSIEQYGSEASLHFETIANYGIQGNFATRDELLKKDYIEECSKLLGEELREFRKKYRVPCITIASHGAEYNSKVRISNNILTEDIESYKALGIKLEAYNKAFIESLGVYISDVPIEINNGYRYGISVMDAVNRGVSPILFLSHPNHWHYSYWGQFKKIVKMIIKGPLVIDDQFVRIAK